MDTALKIENLKFSYSANLPVLDIESLELKRGERVFIFGPSGCGKTTLLGLIAGVLPVQQGQLHVLGLSMSATPERQRDLFRGEHIGYVFQMFNLIPYLNAYENIVLPCRLNDARRERVAGDLRLEVEAISKRLGIAEILPRKVTDLSVGQQQRVAAARALLGHPEIITADEPTSALDAGHRMAFLDVLLSQAAVSKATVIFVSHDRELAKHFDRTLSIPELNRALMAEK